MASKIYQFRAPEKFQDIIEKISNLTGCENKADVIREALSYYDWMLEEIRNGRQIVAISEDSKKIIKPVQPRIVASARCN